MAGLPCPVPPRAGIYRLAGTLHGLPLLIAYDDTGEARLRMIENASDDSSEREQLVDWLRGRGVTLSARPPLSLVTGRDGRDGMQGASR